MLLAAGVGAAFLVATVGFGRVQELYWSDRYPATSVEVEAKWTPGSGTLVATAVLAVAAAVVRRRDVAAP